MFSPFLFFYFSFPFPKLICPKERHGLPLNLVGFRTRLHELGIRMHWRFQFFNHPGSSNTNVDGYRDVIRILHFSQSPTLIFLFHPLDFLRIFIRGDLLHFFIIWG